MNLHKAIAGGHSNKRRSVGQPVHHRARTGTSARRLLPLALALLVVGCTSVYHRTRTALPPDPAADVQLRIGEAREAGERTIQAARKLLKHLRQGTVDARVVAVDFDRLEAAAYDLDRRVWAARDAVTRTGEGEQRHAEVDQLAASAQAWLDYVQSQRSAERSAQIPRLEALLAPSVDIGQGEM
jgi:hypothetical protein